MSRIHDQRRSFRKWLAAADGPGRHRVAGFLAEAGSSNLGFRRLGEDLIVGRRLRESPECGQKQGVSCQGIAARLIRKYNRAEMFRDVIRVASGSASRLPA